MSTAAAVIDTLGTDASDEDIRQLADLLLDAVDDNAAVSFMPDLTRGAAAAWWRSMLEEAGARGAVLVARLDAAIVGTVQLHPSWAPNQPHRGDIAKLIVHRRARGRGIARALMQRVEQLAHANGFTLLMLNTRSGGPPERLYASLGWTRSGEVPDFALNPDGALHATAFYWKRI